MIRMARFKLRSEMREGEILRRDMYEGKGERKRILEILNKDRRGEGWMKRLQKLREEGRDGRERETEDGRMMDEYERKREKK